MSDSTLELIIPASYSKKTAARNIKALSSCAPEMLQALTDVFVHSLPAKRLYLKVKLSSFPLSSGLKFYFTLMK